MQYIPALETAILIAIGIGGALALGFAWLVIALQESPRDDWPNTKEGRAACKQATEFNELRCVAGALTLASESNEPN